MLNFISRSVFIMGAFLFFASASSGFANQNGGIYTPSFFVPGPPVAINNVTDEGLIFFNTYGIFPPNYLFWDDVHPTTQGHQLVAGLVLKSIQRRTCLKH